LTLIDAAGAKQIIKQSEVESKKKTGKSVMPDGLQGGLTPADFADLVGYLESLRDKAPASPKKLTTAAPGVGSGTLSLSHSTNLSTLVPANRLTLPRLIAASRTTLPSLPARSRSSAPH
ncbi:MAG TPA: hypothetical protein VE988_15840, partial [Gemmataceae bacterium]|nr:hypothetical protein [Gemmataceae bacterium]